MSRSYRQVARSVVVVALLAWLLAGCGTGTNRGMTESGPAAIPQAGASVGDLSEFQCPLDTAAISRLMSTPMTLSGQPTESCSFAGPGRASNLSDVFNVMIQRLANMDMNRYRQINQNVAGCVIDNDLTLSDRQAASSACDIAQSPTLTASVAIVGRSGTLYNVALAAGRNANLTLAELTTKAQVVAEAVAGN